MPKVDEVREFAATPSVLMPSIRKVASSLGWRVMLDEPTNITIKENAVNLVSGTWPAELAISVKKHGTGSRVTINGAIFGYGPIQKNHLKGQIGRFLNSLTTLAMTSEAKSSRTSGDGSYSVASEVKKLAKLHADGLLSDKEFARAKAKLLD
jgi:hypothetical protein